MPQTQSYGARQAIKLPIGVQPGGEWDGPEIPGRRRLMADRRRRGGKRTVDMREVVNGVMYVLSTGCQWRYIPKDLPPRSTVHDYFSRWGYDGTLEKIHYTLYVKCREQDEAEASPTACIVDSQSVKSAEKGGPASMPMDSMPVS
jgi:transposase